MAQASQAKQHRQDPPDPQVTLFACSGACRSPAGLKEVPQALFRGLKTNQVVCPAPAPLRPSCWHPDAAFLQSPGCPAALAADEVADDVGQRLLGGDESSHRWSPDPIRLHRADGPLALLWERCHHVGRGQRARCWCVGG